MSKVLIDSRRVGTDLMGRIKYGSKKDYIKHFLVVSPIEFAKPVVRYVYNFVYLLSSLSDRHE